MKYREVNLLGGFYKDASLPWSSQDTVNWLPVPAQAEGTRSPMKLRGVPGLNSMSPDAINVLTLTGDAPNAIEDEAYPSYSYAEEGGTGPYTFVISSGTLPDGLAMSSAGVITGTPTTPQFSSFVVRVSDASGQTAELPDTIEIFAASIGIVFVPASYNESTANLIDFNVPEGFGSGDYAILISASDSRTSTPPNFNSGSFPAFPPGDLVELEGWSSSLRGGIQIAKLRSQDAPILKIRTGTESAKNAAVVVGFIPASFVDSAIEAEWNARFGAGSIGPITGGNVNSLVFSVATGASSMLVTSQAYPSVNNVTVSTSAGSRNVKLSVNWAVFPSGTFPATSFSGLNIERSFFGLMELNGAAL